MLCAKMRHRHDHQNGPGNYSELIPGLLHSIPDAFAPEKYRHMNKSAEKGNRRDQGNADAVQNVDSWAP